MILQPRDDAVFDSLYRYRYLTSEHLRWLHFYRSSARVVQSRLRRLWSNHYIERVYLPYILVADNTPPSRLRYPIYALALNGAQRVADRLQIPIESIPHSAARHERRLGTMEHDLIANSLLAAADVAATQCTRRVKAIVEPEHVLKSKLNINTPGRLTPRGGLLSDGAFTLEDPTTSERRTFHVEVVRAGVRGGNQTLLDKLKKYVLYNRNGYFQDVYGHSRVRGVLVVFPSAGRAETIMRQLDTRRVDSQLLWFSHYSDDAETARWKSRLTPDNLFDEPWRTTDGGTVTIRSS